MVDTSQCDGRYTLRITQGADWSLPLEVKDADGTPRDLTGYTALMHVRRYMTDSEPLLVLSSASGDPDTSGVIEIGPAPGAVLLRLPATVTAGLPWATAQYDLFLYDPDRRPECLLRGVVAIDPAVTRQ